MTGSNRYLRKIEQEAGDKPAVPDVRQIAQTNTAAIPRKAILRKQYGAFKKTSVGLEIGENPRFEDWQELGDDLMEEVRVINWWLGDYIAAGEDIGYGDVAKIADEIGRDRGTLANYASVSRLVKLSLRHESLEYSHHVVVARADWTDEQKSDWLNKAAAGNWSVRKLRDEINTAQLAASADGNTTIAPAGDAPDPPAPEPKRFIVMPPPIKDREHRERMTTIYKKVADDTLTDDDLQDVVMVRKWCDMVLEQHRNRPK